MRRFSAFLLSICSVFVIVLLMRMPSKETFDELFCEKTHFSEKALPITALASYFGSGNTWTRQIIEKATGRSIQNFQNLNTSMELITHFKRCLGDVMEITAAAIKKKENRTVGLWSYHYNHYQPNLVHETYIFQRMNPHQWYKIEFDHICLNSFIVAKRAGIYTGCDYTDTDLKRNGFLGESITNGSTVVVKTHGWTPRTLRPFKKAVLLIRNPYDAILSNFHLRHSKSHTGTATEEEFKKDWDKYVAAGAKQWQELYLTWLKFKGPLHIIRYEDLQANFVSEVTALVKFLNFPVLHTRLACAMVDRYEKFHRRKNDIHSISLYSTEQRKIIDDYISMVEREIQRIRK